MAAPDEQTGADKKVPLVGKTAGDLKMSPDVETVANKKLSSTEDVAPDLTVLPDEEASVYEDGAANDYQKMPHDLEG